MKSSEKYLILCITVMTGAYLWLIYRYAKQIETQTTDTWIPTRSDPEDDIPPGFVVKGLNDE